MKGSSELNSISPQYPYSLIFSDNFIDFSSSIFDKGVELVLPIFASEKILGFEIRKDAHKDFEDDLLGWIFIVMKLQFYFSKLKALPYCGSAYFKELLGLSFIILFLYHGYLFEVYLFEGFVTIMNPCKF